MLYGGIVQPPLPVEEAQFIPNSWYKLRYPLLGTYSELIKPPLISADAFAQFGTVDGNVCLDHLAKCLEWYRSIPSDPRRLFNGEPAQVLCQIDWGKRPIVLKPDDDVRSGFQTQSSGASVASPSHAANDARRRGGVEETRVKVSDGEGSKGLMLAEDTPVNDKLSIADNDDWMRDGGGQHQVSEDQRARSGAYALGRASSSSTARVDRISRNVVFANDWNSSVPSLCSEATARSSMLSLETVNSSLECSDPPVRVVTDSIGESFSSKARRLVRRLLRQTEKGQ